MQGTGQFNGSTYEPFNICSGVKQGYVLAPTLFGIFFALLLSTHLAHQEKVFTSVCDQMAGFSISPASDSPS